ncbi:MAG: type II secretion system F family protein [Actinobacteria bacterium]|nr:MAG: type II secretion system F family protein [Actinomycetota bacterium]TMM26814.1 MAG: type II secretion system F family protein [Actinomycetota bacterium]
MLLIFFAVLFLAAAAYLVGEAATAPAREREGSVKRAANYGKVRAALGEREQPFHDRVIGPARDRLARFVLRVHPKTTVDGVRSRLLAAGLRTVSPTGFLAAKAAVGIGGLVLGMLLGGAFSGGPGVLIFGIVLGGIGFLAPDFVVGLRARKRRDQIRTQLPDALDLLAVSVEAGLGFDGAISKLIDHMDGALSEEFSLTLNEIRIGESRQDALKKLSDRADTPEISGFTRAIIQADQLGISLGRILRVQATDTRQRRQAAAEERAMKAPIKMLFPTVLFIFPAMFLVILGPAFLNLSKIF